MQYREDRKGYLEVKVRLLVTVVTVESIERVLPAVTQRTNVFVYRETSTECIGRVIVVVTTPES